MAPAVKVEDVKEGSRFLRADDSRAQGPLVEEELHQR